MRVALPAQPATAAATPNAVIAALINDPAALSALAAALAKSGLADEVHASIDAAVAQHARGEAGRLLAGVVSTLTGWLIPAAGAIPAKAMVYLNGGSVATACMVASYILPDLAAGAQVWVEAVNGVRADLMIVGLRAFTATPAAQAGATAVQRAGDTMTGALTGTAFHGPADTALIAEALDSGATGALPAGVTIGGGQVNLDGSPPKRLLGIQFLNGSASGTFSHGLLNTPSGVFCNTDNGSNSTTFGSGSYTSSSVFIYVASGQAFVAEVMRGG